jgi:hypothetical protein
MEGGSAVLAMLQVNQKSGRMIVTIVILWVLRFTKGHNNNNEWFLSLFF